jgi:hypothetical protein
MSWPRVGEIVKSGNGVRNQIIDLNRVYPGPDMAEQSHLPINSSSRQSVTTRKFCPVFGDVPTTAVTVPNPGGKNFHTHLCQPRRNRPAVRRVGSGCVVMRSSVRDPDQVHQSFQPLAVCGGYSGTALYKVRPPRASRLKWAASKRSSGAG